MSKYHKKYYDRKKKRDLLEQVQQLRKTIAKAEYISSMVKTEVLDSTLNLEKEISTCLFEEYEEDRPHSEFIFLCNEGDPLYLSSVLDELNEDGLELLKNKIEVQYRIRAKK